MSDVVCIFNRYTDIITNKDSLIIKIGLSLEISLP